ncbi:hypothetical protein [Gimesia sp.]
MNDNDKNNKQKSDDKSNRVQEKPEEPKIQIVQESRTRPMDK